MNRIADGRHRDGLRTAYPTRRLAFIAGGSFALVCAGFAASNAYSTTLQTQEPSMQIYRSGDAPSTKAPESGFTGDVTIGGYFRRDAPSRLAGATVTFAPGVRTPWKVNPMGQTLIVTSGVGWAQRAGGKVIEIRAGDVVWCPPGERHWEGATPDQAMTYVAVQEEAGAGGVRFGVRVTDEEYRMGVPDEAVGSDR